MNKNNRFSLIFHAYKEYFLKSNIYFNMTKDLIHHSRLG